MVSSEILAEIQAFHSASCPPESIIDIYGSSAYSLEERQSDIDLFFLADEKKTYQFAPLLSFVKGLHIRHGREIDAEVPFENKLMYEENEILAAIALEGFSIDSKNHGIIVPPVQKTAEFLGSNKIKLRLVLNALTTPQIVVGPREKMVSFSRRAEISSTLLGISLYGEEKFGHEEILNALCVGNEGESGEMHLGYKPENPLVLRHMEDFIDRSLAELCSDGVLRATGHMFIRPANFRPQQIARQYS